MIRYIKCTIGHNMLWSLCQTAYETTEWHRHEIYECILCRAGSGKLELEDREIDLCGGRTLFIAPDVPHRYRFRKGETAEVKFLCLTAQDVVSHLAPSQIAILDGIKKLSVSCADHEDQGTTIWNLAALIPDGFNLHDACEMRIVWSAIGLLLAMHSKECDGSEERIERRYRSKIQKIRTWIDGQLHEDIRLENVAEHFGLSRSLLTREFRRHTGKSFVDYCNGRRIERAAKMLAASEKPVASVAEESGFTNLSHFHRQFKAIYGLTPAAFRRQVSS